MDHPPGPCSKTTIGFLSMCPELARSASRPKERLRPPLGQVPAGSLAGPCALRRQPIPQHRLIGPLASQLHAHEIISTGRALAGGKNRAKPRPAARVPRNSVVKKATCPRFTLCVPPGKPVPSFAEPVPACGPATRPQAQRLSLAHF